MAASCLETRQTERTRRWVPVSLQSGTELMKAGQASKKRKATTQPTDVDLDDIDVENLPIDASCNQIRGKIRRLLDSGEVKKGEFAKAIGVSSKSLNGFLGQTGAMDGAGSASYDGAWEYFKKRELAGIKMPVKKAKLSMGSIAAGQPSSGAIVDVTGIRVSGEAMDAVAIYDSCDEVRRKVNAHLAKPGITQAAFCRDLEAQLHTPIQKVQSKQLTDFRNKKGPTAGNTSVVYYTAYVYFEKLRLAEGKPKSKHRVQMEGQWPTGMDTDRVRNR